MNYYELIFGALIGFLVSIFTTVATKKIDSLGELKIYTKIVHRRNHRNWGFIEKAENDITLYVPLWIQIQNTSSIPKIVRDFNLYAYNENVYMDKAIQIHHSGDPKEREAYGDNGSYSFLIEPLSIASYGCLFAIRRKDLNASFDELRIHYYDTKDEEKTFKFKEISNCWDTKPREIDKNWIKISSSK